MRDVRIDLHCHSTASDGTDSPAGLVRAAATAGLDVVAITDHDTTAGWAEATAALPPGLRLLRGAEFSCVSPDGRGGSVSVHLLGYLFDPASPSIDAEQFRLRNERRRRLRVMAERMAADGLPVDPDALLDGLPSDAPAGRPHLAEVLVKAGVVACVGEAFARFLYTGGPYYAGRADTDVATAVRMVREAGGVPVLAHAFASIRGPVVEPEVIVDLAADGLAGVEVFHPDHDTAARDRLAALPTDLDLVVTGSSDYHGTHKTVRLGQETTAAAMCERIEAAASGVPALAG